MRHVVDVELAEALALGDALGQQAGADAVRRRQAVADEQDDVSGLARAGRIDIPGDRGAACLHFISAGLERDVAQDQGRLVLAVLALDELRGAPENLCIGFAVDGDGYGVRLLQAGKFDFEIEARGGQNVGAVQRINRLRAGRRHEDESGDGQGDDGAHGGLL